VGTHDFAAFGSPPRANGTTVRTVYQAMWLPMPTAAGSPPGWAFEISGNAFLYHMVRRLVGFQVAIGQGLVPLQALGERLEHPAGEMVKTLAPPHGLTLVEVVYEDDFVKQS
jgi:tRNA pseudouridine38-40 synthase